MSIWTREEEKAHRRLSAVRLLSDTTTICVTRESFLRSSSDTLNQKGRSSMMSFLPESRVETVEQCEEQIPTIACAYQADALVRRTESWKPSAEFGLEAITGVTALHSRDSDALLEQSRRDHGGRVGGCGALSIQDRLAIICNFLAGNNAGARDVAGCLYGPVAA
jgi:hypothetical protein